jgi:hypothetical protein
MLSLAAASGSGEHIQAFSDACNDALDLRARATVALQRS